MGTRTLGLFFKIATVMALISLIMIFIVEWASAEFFITAVSLFISGAISVISGILFVRSAKNDKK